MSSVKLQGGASGAGSVALVAPNTNSVRSLTLPDFDGLLIGSASAGTAGQVLTSAGDGAAPTWESVTGTGTVTSVDVSGGATGLTFSGGPVTSSGTLTLDGTLAVAYGGTGVTTSTGTGSVVLSDSPTLAGTVTASALTVNGQLALGAAAPMSLNGSQGTAGQVLTSAGPGTTPTWESVTGTGTGTGTVTSVDVSGGATGLTFSGGPVTSSGTITLSGTLAVANGGTGTTTSTGTGNVVLSDSPTLVTPNLGTPSAVDLTNATGLNLAAGVTGTLPIANGGTGTTTSTGTGSVVLSESPMFTGTVTASVLTVNGQLDLSAAAPISLNGWMGTAGQVLTSAGAWAIPTWTTPATGTVTSVDVSGADTGLNFYGGPVTSSGTLTLDGTLAVAYGGTGTTTSTGTGSVVLSSYPTFTGTVSTDSLTVNGQLALGAAAPISLNGWMGTAGQVLTAAGPGATPTWTTPTTGTVTSVDVSGADTGLNFYGGPITGAGTITLYGTLAVAYGGTGTTTSTGTGSVVLSGSPVLVTPNLGTPSAVDLANAINLPLSTGVTGVLPITSGGTGTTTSTGTGSVVLSESPTFTGTVSGASLSLTEQLGVGSAPLTGVTLTTYTGFQGTPVATGTDVTGVNSRFQSAGVALDMGVYSSGSCFLQTRLVSDHSSMFTLALNPLGGSVLVGTSVYFSNQLVTGDSGTTVTINFNASQKQALVLTANCTIFTIFPGIGNYQLLLAQDSTGGRTVTWGGSVQYVGSATAPAINTVANGYTMVSIYWNGDAMWLAASKVNA